MDEINLLVQEYNSTEDLQRQRLARLYDLMDARKGYRKVQFGISHSWNNCWNRGNHDVALAQFVDSLILKITGVTPGDPA